MDKNEPNLMTQDRLKRLIKAGFPFNPVSGEEISGQNLYRLKQKMEIFKWDDPRFVTKEEAALNGWEIKDEQPIVRLQVRDRVYGHLNEIDMINASCLAQIPGIEAMQNMSNDELKSMQEKGKAFEYEESFGEDLYIAPARELALAQPEAAPALESVKQQSSAESTKEVPYVVKAEYWRAGLHNTKGIALATRLNEEIEKNKLMLDPTAIQELLNKNPEARKFGLKVVTEEELRKDRNYKLNIAEPKSLNNNMYMRDEKLGAYRPAGGGRVVLQDNADSIQIKSRSKDAYRAAIELAVAKGWTAIELKGRKSMMPDLWLEAKLKGLEVVNYKPTEKDIERFNKRLDELSKETAQDLSKRKIVFEQPIEQDDQQEVESEGKQQEKQNSVSEQQSTRHDNGTFIEPPVVESASLSVLDDLGNSHSIQVRYEMRYDLSGLQVESFDNPKEAAKRFAKQPGFTMPMVSKISTSVDGVSKEAQIAHTTLLGNGGYKRVLRPQVDQTFSELAEAEMIEEGLLPKINHKNAVFSGVITQIDKENNLVYQKTGPRQSDITAHKLDAFSNDLKIDQNMTVEYNKMGHVRELKEVERSLGRELLR